VVNRRRLHTAVAACFICFLSVAGCTTGAKVEFAPIGHALAIFPSPIACHNPPLPRQLGYIFTPVGISQLFNGGWLVADGGSFNRYGSKVVMFNAKGKPIWAVTAGSMDFVHSAVMTTRGNILISDTNNNRVIEVDPRTCRVVFNTDKLGPHGHGFLGRGRLSDGSQLLYPNDAEEIPNGHYLISSRLNDTVFEIDRHGHVFWKCHSFLNLQGKPDHLHGQHAPHRLPNGDTIISDSDDARIIIVNRNCTRMVWEYTGHPPYGHQPLEWPRDGEVMANGDVLVDDSNHNRCLEVNHSHETVRKYYDLPQPYSCLPLKNGLVASANGNTHGIVLWLPGAPQAQPAALLPPKPIKNPFGKPPSHLVNGGFESPQGRPCLVTGSNCDPSGYPPSGGPYGWQLDDLLTETLPPGTYANMAFDSNVSDFGYSSARITWNSSKSHAPLWWGQVVKVFPYRWYTLSYYIQTKNVRLCTLCNFGKGSDPGKYAYMAAQLIRPSPWANISLPSLPKITGTHSWTKYTETFFVPQGTRFLNIECLLTGRGTVWFDAVKLRMTPQRLQPGT
jgi:hypothetical protein